MCASYVYLFDFAFMVLNNCLGIMILENIFTFENILTQIEEFLINIKKIDIISHYNVDFLCLALSVICKLHNIRSPFKIPFSLVLPIVFPFRAHAFFNWDPTPLFMEWHYCTCVTLKIS